ncbi:AEC family transporter [Xenorhabdus innexi]|uniref:Transporter n=1 Tax=Xenorhabdus innexi TaxID=290109 RepID=A0A1N6MSF9_9GAMM|nr:AEC family transporter [Xenorhabdus innexi]PHM36309.1 transporter [Xenorhabdus innexi]SIP71782.1 conserved membrane hypothetical protein [Xenorhabdus innexi]
MNQIITILWPLFALILLGFMLKRSASFSPFFWQGTEKLNYFLLFPALLINSLATASLDNPQLPRLFWAILAILGTGLFILIIIKWLLKWPAQRFGVYVQGLLRFNTYLGLAITVDIFGSHGIAVASLIIAILVPLCNAISVFALTPDIKTLSIKQFVVIITKNPLILACFIGIGLNLTNLGLPYGSGQFLKILAGASLPLGLICIGASLQPAMLRTEKKPIIINSLSRLLFMPLVAGVVGYLLELDVLEINLLILFFAIPTAPTAYILTRQLNGDSQLMSAIITLQTMFAVITLPIILGLRLD